MQREDRGVRAADSQDFLSPQARSALMAKIASRNTGPERVVRSLLYRAGLRYRLHVNTLPGKPDIVLSKYRTAIFVHGCFWHGHSCAKGTHLPRTREEFWSDKLSRNKERDAENQLELRDMGWRVVVVWECELKDPAVVLDRLVREINP